MANLVTWLVVAYFAVLGNNLLRTFFPATCSESDDPQTCIHPLLPKDGRVDLYAFAAPDPRDREYWRPDRRSDAELILAVTNLRLSDELHTRVTLPARRFGLRTGNASLYAHVYLFRANASSAEADSRGNATVVADAAGLAAVAPLAPGRRQLGYVTAPLTRHMPMQRRRSGKKLLGSGGAAAADNATASASASEDDTTAAAGAEEAEAATGAAAATDSGATCAAGDETCAAPAPADAPSEAGALVAPGSEEATTSEEAAAGALEDEDETEEAEEAELEARRVPVAHLRGKLALRASHPAPTFPRASYPGELGAFVERKQNRRGLYVYRPFVSLDDLGTTRRSWVLLARRRARADPSINVTVEAHGIGPFTLYTQLETTVTLLRERMGLSEEDVDEVKEMVSGTNLRWWLLTTVVGVLHSFFAYLAFKNDIGFWKARSSLEGLSVRTYASNFVCSVIILLKLLDGNTSNLILAEVGISTAIEGWKVSKIMRRRGTLARWLGGAGAGGDGAGGNGAPAMSEKEAETDEADARAMRWLTYALYPLVAGWGCYSLLRHEHRGWWSWAVQTASYGVYLWGFVAMTPQLYINYRLKSVAHLPWRAMMYKVFNTFIDDVFAFAIEMPLSHRIACLRDDVIFFAYLYQRWLYPVDLARPNEFGRAYLDDAIEGEAARALAGGAGEAAAGGAGAAALAGGDAGAADAADASARGVPPAAEAAAAAKGD